MHNVKEIMNIKENSFCKRGSEWRKWDLHIHSDASPDSKSNPSDIIGKLIDEKISVFSVTDHSSVDNVDTFISLCEQKRDLGEEIYFLPGVEIKTDKGDKSVHILAIFPEKDLNGNKTSTAYLKENFLSAIGCTEAKLLEIGKEKLGDGKTEKKYIERGQLEFVVNFEDVSKKIKELGGICIVHAGSKSNSIENEISHSRSNDDNDLLNSLGHLKEVLMKKHIDICELPNSLEKSKTQRDFYLEKFNKPSLVSSDSHKLDEIGQRFTWIKSDPTFLGLKQIINEPSERICLDSLPEKIENTASNKCKYIDSIKMNNTTANATTSWFQDELLLNSGLVAIIGKKGSGKSALADIVSLCGDSKINSSDYSFLTQQKFRKRNLAKGYEGTITWLDEQSNCKNLGEEVTATSPERIKYLPQQYVENICNEDGVSKLFQQEIDKVIFSYVPEENRLGTHSLVELIKKKTESIDENITTTRTELHKINAEIVLLEDKESPKYLESLQKNIEVKKQELKNLKKPKVIRKPKTTLNKVTEEKIKKLTASVVEINSKISIAREDLKDVNNKLHKINKIADKIKSFKTDFDTLVSSFNGDAIELSIDLSKIIKLEISDEDIDTKKSELATRKDKLDEILKQSDPSLSTSLYNQKTEFENELKKITETLDADQKKYKEYQQNLKKYEENKQVIEGKKGDISMNTIAGIETEVYFVKNKLGSVLKDLFKKRSDTSKKLFSELEQKISFYQDIYTPLVNFIKSEEDTQKKSGSKLSFSAGLTFGKQKFVDDFFSFINQGKDGSFQTVVGGQKMLDGLIEKYNFEKKTDTSEFTNDVLEHLKNDKTQTAPKVNNIKSQLKKDQVAFYDFLFGLNYLDVKYKILFNDKDLNANEFSPGEKGALLLIFYLLIDKENIPLVIDQPEENLDNESVYTLLVPYIKKAKQRRQIIAVTHNPNIAVVCDAEQIICATMDKKNNEVRYISGSMENPLINKKIVDILEGTLPAFSARDKKYIRKIKN